MSIMLVMLVVNLILLEFKTFALLLSGSKELSHTLSFEGLGWSTCVGTGSMVDHPCGHRI